MGLMDVFKANENKKLQERIAELEKMLSPEQQEILRLKDEIAQLENTVQIKRGEVSGIVSEIDKNRRILGGINSEIQYKKSQSTALDEELMLESFGLYTPRFSFTKSEQYKRRLDEVRQFQKTMIKNNGAVLGSQKLDGERKRRPGKENGRRYAEAPAPRVQRGMRRACRKGEIQQLRRLPQAYKRFLRRHKQARKHDAYFDIPRLSGG